MSILKRKRQQENIPANENEYIQAEYDMEELGAITADGIKEADKMAATKIDEEFLADIKFQEEELKKEIPEFNLADEIEKNPMFAVMLSFKEPMAKVYGYFNPEVVYKEIEQDILERIKARNLRPAHVEQRGKSKGVDVNSLSASDIAEIDKRVRRGERVEL